MFHSYRSLLKCVLVVLIALLALPGALAQDTTSAASLLAGR